MEVIYNMLYLFYIVKPTMWGPQTIAKLVQITPKTMMYGTYNYSFHVF